MGERARFSKGLYAWIGFPSIGVPFEVAERAHGGPASSTLRKLFRFALDGITSFSTLPLKLWTYVGARRVGVRDPDGDLLHRADDDAAASTCPAMPR